RRGHIAELQADAAGMAANMWLGNMGRAHHSQFHGLRREILDAVAGVRAKNMAPVILVTSAVPGDGKTFVSLGLARVLSSVREFTTTLVDADLVRARMSGIWGVRDMPGLAECMRGELSPPEVVLATRFPRVEIIGSGKAEAEGAEELAGTGPKEVNTLLRGAGAGRLFLMDAPPLLNVPETMNVARFADLVVIVVRAGVTPLPAVREALEMLNGLNVVAAVNGAVATNSLLDGGYYRESYE